jgi:hypothetical protein
MKTSLLLALSLTCALGCSSASSDSATAGDEQDINSASNVDVQVLRAAASGTVFTEGHPLFNRHNCKFFDVQPESPEKGIAKADCTDEIMKGFGLPSINNYIENLAWVRLAPGTTGVVGEQFRHWCAKVEVDIAIKAAAWDSASFEGVGFFAQDPALGVPDDKSRVFYAKGDTRLVRKGEATLKNGEKAYLYSFIGAGPCEVNGTGNNPSRELVFKPFVTYAGGHERWEAISGNHGIGYRKSWDRSGDLLK